MTAAGQAAAGASGSAAWMHPAAKWSVEPHL